MCSGKSQTSVGFNEMLSVAELFLSHGTFMMGAISIM